MHWISARFYEMDDWSKSKLLSVQKTDKKGLITTLALKMQKSVCLSISFYNKQGICPFAQPSNSKDFDLYIVRNTVNSPRNSVARA